MSGFQVVKETSKGKLVYPPDLPGMRGNLAQVCGGCVSAVLFSVGGYLGSDCFISKPEAFTFVAVTAINTISLISILHIVIKTFTFFEELKHLHTRHNDSVIALIKKAYSFNIQSTLLGGASFLLSPWTWFLHGFNHMFYCELPPLGLLPIFAACFILQWIVKMEWSHIQDSISVEDRNGMDYGSGMAYSFFYGFLHIVLPITGDANKGIRERIDEYIASKGLQDHQFPVKKLFILIPSSKYIPCSLDEHSDGWMLPADSLGEQQFNVAGVRKRVYKNSVYKIRDPDLEGRIGYIYVVAEGATPLRTLDEVVNRSTAKSGYYREHQKEIIHMFFHTLRSILQEDERTKNNCELIYYVDDDEHGEKVNVGKMILERIKELKEKEAEKDRRRRLYPDCEKDIEPSAPLMPVVIDMPS